MRDERNPRSGILPRQNANGVPGRWRWDCSRANPDGHPAFQAGGQSELGSEARGTHRPIPDHRIRDGGEATTFPSRNPKISNREAWGWMPGEGTPGEIWGRRSLWRGRRAQPENPWTSGLSSREGFRSQEVQDGWGWVLESVWEGRLGGIRRQAEGAHRRWRACRCNSRVTPRCRRTMQD
jgi:hypothetical protein